MKKQPTPPLIKHAEHQVEVRLSHTKHFAQYYCLDCNKSIAWLTQKQAIEADRLGLIKR